MGTGKPSVFLFQLLGGGRTLPNSDCLVRPRFPVCRVTSHPSPGPPTAVKQSNRTSRYQIVPQHKKLSCEQLFHSFFNNLNKLIPFQRRWLLVPVVRRLPVFPFRGGSTWCLCCSRYIFVLLRWITKQMARSDRRLQSEFYRL